MNFFRLTLLLSASAAIGLAQAPPKIAIVNIQDAIVATTDGQHADQQLEAEFAPKKARLEEQHKAIEALQNRLEQENLNDEDRKRLTKELDDKTVLANLETDKDDADLDAAQKKVLTTLGKKMVAVIAEYAARSGYSMVFDISTSQAPLLYADNATDITKEVVAAYEAKYKK